MHGRRSSFCPIAPMSELLITTGCTHLCSNISSVFLPKPSKTSSQIHYKPVPMSRRTAFSVSVSFSLLLYALIEWAFKIQDMLNKVFTNCIIRQPALLYYMEISKISNVSFFFNKWTQSLNKMLPNPDHNITRNI